MTTSTLSDSDPTKEVDCTKVQGRRTLTFNSMEEALADAEALVAAPKVRTVGNHSLGQLLAHLGIAINSSIDGFSGRAPWFIRMLAPVIKPTIMAKGMRPGFRLSKKRESGAFPPTVSPTEGLDKFRKAVERSRVEQMTAAHPAFGRCTHEEWKKLHCHHAALHLSFCIPE